MKKKHFIFLIIALVLLVVLITSFNYFKTTNTYVEDNINNQTKITKGISMNLEQTAGAGDYKTVTQSGWPTEGYKFNTELSRCENGSELSWDDTKKAVIVSGNLSDKCYVYFDKVLTLANYVKSQYTGTQGDNSLYYHNSTLTNGAGDNSYRYAGGDYVLTDAGKATGATMMIGYNNSVTTALIDFYCNGTKQYVGYGCSSSQTHYYLIKGDTTQYQTYNEALSASVEKGYLTKDNVKNFVCFGTDASPCPTENLYRIIGVFNNQVKLVKWDYAKSSLLGTDGDFSQEYTSNYFSGEQGESPSSNSLYYWNNDTKKNTWSESNLNKVNLNTNFVNNIGTIWSNKIATTTWKVGGGSYTNIVTSVPKTAYQYEVGSNASSTTYESKIGLKYVTDYEFAANPNSWTLVGYNSSDATKDYRFSKGENWLYGGGWDWTISRSSDNSNDAFRVYDYGRVSNLYVSNYFGARPSFSLLSSTSYVSGSGSMSDPIIIE
jgi:hypothetical protein